MDTPPISWVDSGPTSLIQWIYREWVWEQGLSEGYNNKIWLWVDWIIRTWTKVWNFVLCLHPRSLLFLLILQCFVTKVSKIIQIARVLPFPRGLLTLYIPFQLILALHLLIMQVTSRVLVPLAALPNLLWVVATKAALFIGHFLINAARTLVVDI